MIMMQYDLYNKNDCFRYIDRLHDYLKYDYNAQEIDQIKHYVKYGFQQVLFENNPLFTVLTGNIFVFIHKTNVIPENAQKADYQIQIVISKPIELKCFDVKDTKKIDTTPKFELL